MAYSLYGNRMSSIRERTEEKERGIRAGSIIVNTMALNSTV